MTWSGNRAAGSSSGSPGRPPRAVLGAAAVVGLSLAAGGVQAAWAVPPQFSWTSPFSLVTSEDLQDVRARQRVARAVYSVLSRDATFDSLEDLEALVSSVSTNRERNAVAQRLLTDLEQTQRAARAADRRDADIVEKRVKRVCRLLLMTWLFHEEATAANAVRLGKGQLAAGDPMAARRSFEVAARADPTWAEAWNKLATAQYQLGENAEALASVHKALALEPRHFGALAGEGLVLARQGRFEAAAAAFRAAEYTAAGGKPVLTARRQAAEVMSWMPAPVQDAAGSALRGANTAVASFQKTYQKEKGGLALPAVVGATLAAVAVFVASTFGVLPGQDWWSKTEMQVQDVTMTLPDGTMEKKRETVMTRFTRVGADLKVLQQAVKGLENNRDRQDLTTRLLDELGVAEDSDRSSAVANLVWKAWLFHENPQVVQAIDLGTEFMAGGQLAEAEEMFIRAIQLDPHYSEAWNKLATVHYLQGKPQASLFEIQVTLALEPRHFGALSGRGMVLMQIGHFGEAAQAFRDAQKVVPGNLGMVEDADMADAMRKQNEGVDPVPLSPALLGERSFHN